MNVAMIKFGVILKILYHRYENAISIPNTLKNIILVKDSIIWWL